MAGAPTAEFISECRDAHNKYRALHGSPPLKMKKKLSEYAQEWATNLANENIFQHRQPQSYGENLYSGSSTDPNWKLKGDVPVKSWYDEVKNYKFGERSPTNMSKVGHFTQVVWRDSVELGIGLSTSLNGTVYVVCNYDPPGNMLGDYEKNVSPPKKTEAKPKEVAGSSETENESSEPSCSPGHGLCGRPELPKCPEARRRVLRGTAGPVEESSNLLVVLMCAVFSLVVALVALVIFNI